MRRSSWGVAVGLLCVSACGAASGEAPVSSTTPSVETVAPVTSTPPATQNTTAGPVSTDTRPPSEAEVPSSKVPIPPLISVPEDPLGFAADGFVAERSIVDPYEIADAYLCGERARADALIGFPVIVDEYDPGAGGSVMTLVSEFVDFGSRDVAADRLAGIEDPIGFCERHGLDVDTDIEVLPAISAGSVEAFGHTDGPSTFWAVVGADGRAVLFRSAGIIDVDDLTGRAASFVGE